MLNSSKLKDGYQVFFDSYVWDIYLTVTFRQSTSASTALRSFKYFFKHLNTPDCVYFKQYIRCFIFCEKQGYQDGVHIHSLIQGVDITRAGLLEEKCRRFFGQSKVEPYQYGSPRLASEYLAEKCVGLSLAHWDFIKINSKLRRKH
jgi:hypothetical protein